MPQTVNNTPYETRRMALCALHEERVPLADDVLVSLYRTALAGWVPDTVMNYHSGQLKLHRPNAAVIETVFPSMTPVNAAHVAGRIGDPLLAELAWRTRKGKQIARALALSDGIAQPLAEKLLAYCRKNFDADVVVTLLKRELVSVEKVLDLLLEDPYRMSEKSGMGNMYETVGAAVAALAAGNAEMEKLVMSVSHPWFTGDIAKMLRKVPKERRRELIALAPDMRTRVELLSTVGGRLNVADAKMVLGMYTQGDCETAAPRQLRFDAEAQALLAQSPHARIAQMLLEDRRLEARTLVALVEAAKRGSFGRGLQELLLDRLLDNPDVGDEVVESLMASWQVLPWNPRVGGVKDGSFPESVKRWLARQATTGPDPLAAVELLSTLLPGWEGTALELRDTVASLS
jgi:hypothetical protein